VGDLHGRRRVFLAGVAIFATGSALCGFSASIRELILARALQGFGAALLVPGSLSIISASFEEQKRGTAIGTWSGFTAITTAIGPVLGGWLIEHGSWRWAFFLNLPLAVAVIAISLWRLPESRSPAARELDTAGGLLVTIGLGGVVYALTESARLGWTDVRVAVAGVAGLMSLMAFALVQSRTRSPMLPLSLFKSRIFTGANLLTLFLYAAFGIFFFLFPLNLIQVQGYSATATGAAALPMILLLFLLSRWSGGLVDRYGPRLPLIVGPLIVALGFVLLTAPSIGGDYWRTFFMPFLVLGLGMAVSVAPLTTVVMNAVGPEHAGTTSGVNNAVSRVAGLLATAILGILMVQTFGARLNRELAQLKVAPAVREALLSQRIDLAAMQVPPLADVTLDAAIRHSIAVSFVHAFREVMLFCAGLALLSALQAILWMGRIPAAAKPHSRVQDRPLPEPR
jgi:EmrB/QacA subfamily drug resistance transporter